MIIRGISEWFHEAAIVVFSFNSLLSFASSFLSIKEHSLAGSMIEIICNDRLGKKVRVKCK